MSFKQRVIQSLWDPNYQENPVACPEIVVPEVTEALYGELLQQLTAAGGKFNGNEATIDGCTLAWTWDQPSDTLRIVCTKKPLLASCGMVESKIRELIEKAKTEAI